MGVTANLLSLLTSSLFVASCGDLPTNSSVNTPLVREEVGVRIGEDEVRAAIDEFARDKSFAVQQRKEQPGGLLEFNVQLFRDDVRITVNKLREGKVEIFAYPLCACEANSSYGLQTAAQAAVNQLKERILASGNH